MSLKIATEATINFKEFGNTYAILDHVKTWKYWKYVCHAAFILAAFLCFLPQILGYNMLLDAYPDQLEDLPANAYLHTALIVSVAVTFVNLLEQIMDSLIQYFPIFRKLEGHTNPITYFEFPKVLLLIILVKDILLLQYILPNEQFNYMPGVLLGSDILFTWCYFFNLTRLGNPVWTLSKAFTISFMLALCNIAYAWTMMSEDAANNENLYLAIQVIVAVAFFLLFWVVGQWIHYTWKIDYKSTDILMYMKVIQTSVFFVFFIFYLLMCWGTAYPVSTSPDWLLICGKDYMVCMVYMMSVCTVLVSIISGRVSKFGSILFSNKLLSVRKMFMRYLSHEMRTPLNTAVMGINLLIKKFENTLNLPKDSTCYDIANDIKSSCAVAVDILSDMLLFDKIESGHLALELAILSPWSLIKKTVRPFFAQAQQMDVLLSLKFMIPCFDCFVNVDKHKLSQVVRNLVSNGLKFCTKPGGYINVDVDVISQNTYQTIIDGINKNGQNQKLAADTSISTDYNTIKYLRLSVTDDGAGISEENQTKLFHGVIQFNAGELQNGQGTGLGLYISKGLINAHKGHIFVKSEGEGHGATFTFLIPIVSDEIVKAVSQKNLFTLSSKTFLSSGKNDNKSNKKNESGDFVLDQVYTFSSADAMNDSVPSDSLVPANDVKIEINSISHTKVATVANSLRVANDTNYNEPEFKIDDDNDNSRYPILGVTPRLDIESPPRVINVLVVDDSGICRLMTKRTIDELKIQGTRIHIDEATDGKKALKMMKIIMNIDDEDPLDSSSEVKKDKSTNANKVTATALYDLVLMDYQMPNMDGPTAISNIRALGYKGQIVGLTGNVLESEVKKMHISGSDKVLTKPVKEEQFENVFLNL